MPVGLPEFAVNPENRVPVVLLLDTSASMSGQPIQELNKGIVALKKDILRDTQASLSVEVAIVGFGPVQLIQDFVTIDNFTPPILEAQGNTPIAEAIDSALDLLEDRKATYKANGIQYYRPWVFLITDGAPTDSSDYWRAAAHRIQEDEANRRLLFFAVGVQGANMQILKQIAPPERPPVLLNGLDFSSLFIWLSTSMKRVSSGKVGEVLALPPVGWGQIST
ncbi:von Willebrand factor, type A (plasmid) [Calothrix sp. PCC 7716]|nr:von Willebrand factor, type A [Calothrix sp. PCC 7716]